MIYKIEGGGKVKKMLFGIFAICSVSIFANTMISDIESEYQELLKKEAEKVAELKIEKVELENELKELKEKSVQKESVLEKLEMDSQIRWHRAEYKKLLKDYKDYYTRLDKKIDEDEEKLIELTKLINVLE